MDLLLYEMKDDHNTINKKLYDELSLPIQLTAQVDVLSPILRLENGSWLNNKNYAYIPAFNRYYFINRRSIINYNLIELYLEVDVLESFKGDILGSKQVYYSQGVYVDIITQLSNKRVNHEVSYVIATLGSDDDGSNNF